MIKFVFPYLRFRVGFSKHFGKFPWIKNAQIQFILNPSELTRTRRHIFFLHLMYAYSSTQIFSSPCGGSFRPSCPHGCFLSTAIVHTDLLVHTTVSFTRTFSLHWHSPQSPTYPHWRFLPHTGLTFVREDIWRLLTFPTNAGFTPLHKNIWRLLDFPTHIESLLSARTYEGNKGHLEVTRLPSQLRPHSCWQR